MELTTLFMSDEEKQGHHFDLPFFFNMSKQYLAAEGLSVFKLVSCKLGASRELAPKAIEVQNVL